ncbi:LysR substrate-binding domain-containing protein [Inquilinus sp. CA228]|uniref:LysR substrate-binding domain-containing protein n=1 Tax=Inquilinus sp. CA228 TaxID=3455609 RepID=UPI003F8D207E
MNIRQIETFAAVMKAGTASRAAELLGVTQPAVSRSLAELERVVGFALFARIRNRLVPTPEARLLYRDVEAAFLGIDTIRASAARIRDRGSGEIRVASLSALSLSLVPKAIRIFRDTHPSVRVTLHVLLSREVRDLIASGEFDIGLAADEIDTTGISHQLFLSRDALCALPVGHPLAAREVITPADIHGEALVAYVPEDRGRQQLDRVLEAAGSVPRVAVETIYASTVYALVAEGVGIGFVNPYSVAGLDRSRIVLRPFEPAIHIKSLLILPADRPKSQLVRDFIGALMAAR